LIVPTGIPVASTMEANMERRTALILGITGGIGGAVAERLVSAGWKVRALHRDPDRAGRDDRFEWVRGDAMQAAEVMAAADGAALIVHAVNPPGYRDWDKLVLPMLDNSIAAATAHGARVLLPGTVYNYGPDAFPAIDETAPQNAVTRKGRIRVAMEARLRAAAERGALRALIVRAGDFFGPGAANSWFSQGLVQSGTRPSVVRAPGRPGVGHQWAYLPDVAETMVRLLDVAALPDFATFHMAGHWDHDGTQMTGAILRALGDPAPKVRPMPWWLMRLMAPFVPTLRELMEMRYLWRVPVRLRSVRLADAIGPEPHTPLDLAVARTLQGLGCIDTGA
jgi:nucleoside-diphosphate-sugar epimerase